MILIKLYDRIFLTLTGEPQVKLGLIGVGVVGGTLKRWLEENTNNEIACYDPAKNLKDDLEGCFAIFISIPVGPGINGQDTKELAETIKFAKKYSPHVFIRSTVNPWTNDAHGTYAMPEFLTARRAYEDFCALPLVFGSAPKEVIESIFWKKIQADGKYIHITNVEAELAKYTHNIFGLYKVTYFNMIFKIAQFFDADFESVKEAANVTGFLGTEHLQVPGPDGKLGFGGACFPVNLDCWIPFLNRCNQLSYNKMQEVEDLFLTIKKFNSKIRK